MTAADVHAAASGIARADVASKGAIEMAENVFRPMMAGYTRLVGQRVAQIGGARCCWRRATRNIFVL